MKPKETYCAGLAKLLPGLHEGQVPRRQVSRGELLAHRETMREAVAAQRLRAQAVLAKQRYTPTQALAMRNLKGGGDGTV
jgi:hypothetical protein